MLREKRICPHCGKELPEHMCHGVRKYHPECAIARKKEIIRQYRGIKVNSSQESAHKSKMKNGMMLIPGMTRAEQARRWSKALERHEEYVRPLSCQFSVMNNFLENQSRRTKSSKKKEIPPHTHRTRFSTAITVEGSRVNLEYRY